MRQSLCLALVSLLMALAALAPIAPAQKQKPKTKPGDEMIYKYLCAETDKLSKKALDGAKTIDEWKQKRPRLHREYMYMLGLDPLPKKTPLKVTFTGSIEHEGIMIDKLHFQSKPGLYVTANLYRPKGTQQSPKAPRRRSGGPKRSKTPRPPSGGLPAVLYVCGHAGRGRDGNKSAYQDHGIWFARNGYICIVLDTLQLGEIPGVHHGTYGVPWRHARSWGETDKKKLGEGPRWWWHSAGYTPAGVECWNGIRAIDYLISRPDVDAKKIAVTGISGGGAATFWIAAADDRVACAVPVSGMSDLESYVKNKVINGHCDCMFLYNTFQWEWTTIAALIAPRPLLFANSDNDRIFPMDGNRRIIKRLRELYAMYHPDKAHRLQSVGLDDYVSAGGHAYRPDLRKAIFRFINKHIKGDAGPVEDSAKFKTLRGKMLRVFPTDADLPKDRINHKIDETFVARTKVKLPGKGEFGGWKKSLLNELREQSFRILPKKIPSAKRLRSFRGISEDYSSEEGVEFQGMTLVFSPTGKKIVTLVIVNPEETLREVSKIWSKQDDFSEALKYMILPRGADKTAWRKKSPPNFVERSHILLGRAVDTGKLRDVIAFLNDFKKLKGKGFTVKIGGRAQAGILAAYAVLLAGGADEVILIDPPTSHKQGPHFLNVLRVLDIPEALGLLAPRVKLTLINAKDRAFDRTAEIYRIAGAGKKFVRK